MIDAWFPTLIYYADLENHKSRNAAYIEKMYAVQKQVSCDHDWNCDTYSTLGTYDLTTDALFDDLIKDCTQHVTSFSKEYGCEGNIKIAGSWFNIASTGQNQEYHVHPNSHFSLVYYVKVSENCGNIFVKGYEIDHDMFPLPTGKERKFPNFKTIFYPPLESRILIFRSNLQHMVETNKSKEDRISIAMNFIVES